VHDVRGRANGTHVRRSRPHSGLSFHTKVRKPFQVVPSLIESGTEKHATSQLEHEGPEKGEQRETDRRRTGDRRETDLGEQEEAGAPGGEARVADALRRHHELRGLCHLRLPPTTPQSAIKSSFAGAWGWTRSEHAHVPTVLPTVGSYRMRGAFDLLPLIVLSRFKSERNCRSVLALAGIRQLVVHIKPGDEADQVMIMT